MFPELLKFPLPFMKMPWETRGKDDIASVVFRGVARRCVQR